jgi:PAS domain S-box-containing protein
MRNRIKLLPSPAPPCAALETAERRVRQSDALYRAIVERTPGVTYLSTLDPACPATYVSPQVSALIGYTPDEVVATPSLWVEAIHPDDRQRVLDRLASTQNTGSIFREEYRLRTKTGEVVWVQDEARLVRDTDGHPLCLQGIMIDVSDRKRAETELQQVNGMLSALVAASPMPIISLDAHRQVMTWNPAAERAYGWRADEVLGQVVPNVPPDRQAEFERIHGSVFTGERSTAETQRLRRDGTAIEVLVSASPVRDADGRIWGSMGVHVDITARKRVEEQLRRSEEQFRSVLENTLDIILLLRPDGTISYVNPATRGMTGFDAADVVGRSVFDVLHRDEVAPARAMLQQVLSPPYEVRNAELRSRHKNGNWLVFEVSGRALVEAGELRGVVLNARDITARRDAESRARAEQTFRSAIEDSLLAGIGTIDIHGRQTYVNRAFAAMVGWTPEELLGKLPPFVYWPDDAIPRYQEVITTCLAGACKPAELPLLRRDGSRLEVLIVPSPMQDADGRVTGWLAVFYDLTDRKQLEAQVRESQKMEAVGRLAGGVAHDFNNLLTAILGYSELVEGQIAGTPAAEDVAQIRQAAESAARLTHQLLAFSRRQVLDPVVLNVNTVVGNLEKMLRRVLGEDVDLRPALAPDLPAVVADRGQLEQIIMNLAVNARDAMPEGGVLTLSTSVATIVARNGDVAPGDYVRLGVEDTGCGIDAQTVTHIFEPFFTTKEAGKGTGLGLATVYGIVKQSGGYIEVTSQPGHGARFDVYLPCAEAAPETLPETAAPRPHGRGTVLVVEDEVPVRNLVRRTLEADGYAVLIAEPATAASVARAHEGTIDVFLLDVVMPVKCGPEVAADLRVIHPEARVLYMTGYTEHAVLERMHVSDSAQVLHKPFTSSLLLATIRDTIDGVAFCS